MNKWVTTAVRKSSGSSEGCSLHHVRFIASSFCFMVKTGKTPVLEGTEWTQIASLDPVDDVARPGIDRHAHLQLRAGLTGGAEISF